MTFPAPERDYQSPPNSGGNDGALPTVYVPQWNGYTNLSEAQKTAFRGFPQDLMVYSQLRRWGAEISGTTVAGIPLTTQDRDQQKIAALKQAFDTGVISSVQFFDASGAVQTVNAAAATAIYSGVVTFVQSTYTTAATLQAQILAKTVTTRAQIDAAYAAIAPNSPSAQGVG